MKSKPPKPQKPPRGTLAALAQKSGIPYGTLSRWKREGVNIYSPSDLAERQARMKSTKSPETITAARLQKLKLESQRLQLQVDAERGRLVDAGVTYRDARSVGTQVRAALDKAAMNDLPPLLAGRNTAEIKTLLLRYFRDLCIELKNTKHPILQNL